MIFNSLVFALFFPVVFILYWFIVNKNLKIQNALLLIASYVFYGYWDWRFLSLLIFSSVTDYWLAILIDRSENEKTRKYWLIISIIANLGLLGFFKYYNFFAESFTTAMGSLGWQVDSVTLSIILPVGISFYVFQTMSYTLDVYRRQLKPTTDLLAFSTFVAFFPQLMAGPIERASNLLWQMEKKRFFDYLKFKEGIFQIIVGLFRKIVIADNLAIYVDTVYGDPTIHNSSTLLLATIFYSFQIYFDFAGYSDIAIGTAKLLGFSFNRNFNLPYFSRSITEFWRRWHISLSSWLKDYLYISLGGNRKGIRIQYRNLMITMLLGGLWHGSSWNFVIWGGIHGVALCVEKFLFGKLKISNLGLFGNIYTYVIVLSAWVFFRASGFEESTFIISKLFSFDYHVPFIGSRNIMFSAISMLFLGLTIDSYLFFSDRNLEELGGIIQKNTLIILITFMIICMALFYSSSENFIYFQF